MIVILSNLCHVIFGFVSTWRKKSARQRIACFLSGKLLSKHICCRIMKVVYLEKHSENNSRVSVPSKIFQPAIQKVTNCTCFSSFFLKIVMKFSLFSRSQLSRSGWPKIGANLQPLLMIGGCKIPIRDTASQRLGWLPGLVNVYITMGKSPFLMGKLTINGHFQ